MRYAVAHGRRSGRGRAAALGARAVTELRSAGHDVVEIEAGSLDEARTRCAAQVAGGVDVLVVAGGDGAVSLATDLCAGTGTAVGILPAGSGNDNARSLRIPHDPDGALRTLLGGQRRTVDTVHVAELDRHLLGSVNTGLDARIAHRATLLPRRLGAAVYTVAALVEIARLRWTPPLRYRLTTSTSGTTSTEELDALVVVPANMPYLGGGLQLAPDADPADGLLDLVVVRPLSPARALVLLRAVREGRHTSMPEVEVRRVNEVTVEGPSDVLAHGDGEPLAPLPLTVRAAASHLQVIAPPLT
ncbi:diacylglycerol/lipid kinase family protein [Ornithinimicrobium tianjinense]|uniref:Diacylglycerol kinase n=1 Tax=Ornithinimicrobium tianjinense TaxID=1195761 RepID=A0A917BJD4_9MICO|nr:diacylglycerol kinase family protein [Ornithinimicrobium tianjinense]GGF47464.1 diacylglycerol kinase [Ornithinimicrobium tianjinense]